MPTQHQDGREERRERQSRSCRTSSGDAGDRRADAGRRCVHHRSCGRLREVHAEREDDADRDRHPLLRRRRTPRGRSTATVVASTPELNASPPARRPHDRLHHVVAPSRTRGSCRRRTRGRASTTRMSSTHSFDSQAHGRRQLDETGEPVERPEHDQGIQAFSPAASARPVPVSTSSTRTSHAVASSVARIEWSACI